jgi:hypothetical protein
MTTATLTGTKPLGPIKRKRPINLHTVRLDNLVAAMGGLHVSTARKPHARYTAWADSGRLEESLEAVEHIGGRRLELVRCQCGGRFAPEGDDAHTAPHRKGQPGHR